MSDQIPTDLQPVPEDLTPAPSGVLGAIQSFYRKGKEAQASQEPQAIQALHKYVPSLPTALSLTVPGGKGLIAALSRIGAAGTSQAGEAILTGRENPLTQGLEGAAAQAIPEALPALGPVVRFGSTMLPGASARATLRGNQALDRLSLQLANINRQGPVAPTPNEKWAKFFPTGLPEKPASQVLAPSGQPAIPAVPAVSPQIVHHPTLRGWTMGDVIEPLAGAAKPTSPVRMGGFEILKRLLGAGGQEAVSRVNE